MRHTHLCLTLLTATACTKSSSAPEFMPMASPTVEAAPVPAGLIGPAAPTSKEHASSLAAASGPAQGLDHAVRDPSFDVGALLAAEPGKRNDLVAALDGCLRQTGTDPNAVLTLSRCLRRMARVDRARAARVANMLPPAKRQEPELADLVLALILFPTPTAMVDELRGIGLLPADLPLGDASAAATPSEVLEALGRSRSFDCETGTFPNRHDLLLTRLAPLGAGTLDDARFEELAPTDRQGPYRLRAYLGGKRYEVEAKNLGDWYDVDAVVGLLNALLAAGGSQQRLATLAPRGQEATVVSGPAVGLTAAQRSGLLRFADADAARRAGKAFEDQVMQRLPGR